MCVLNLIHYKVIIVDHSNTLFLQLIAVLRLHVHKTCIIVLQLRLLFMSFKRVSSPATVSVR